MSLEFLLLNIETALWLRRIWYDRMEKGRTIGVFVLSALWVRRLIFYHFIIKYSIDRISKC